jgi:spermidine/putrescine transport system substrate-binding protein
MRETRGVYYGDDAFIAPMDWGNSSIIYRTDIYEGEETWMMLFDERYKGKIGARNGSSNAWAAAQILGFDIFAPTEEQLEGPIADMLRKQRDLVRFYWDDQSEAEQAIASGEVVVAYAWNAALKNLKDQGIPVAYANPKEGIWTWCCGLARIATGDADENLVYDLINAWMAPESGVYLIDSYGYGHSNQEAFARVPPERLDELGISSPSELFAKGVFFKPLDPLTENRYQTMWDEIISGF